MLLLVLVVSFQAPMNQAPPTPQSAVWVDGRGFRIPRLPESQNQAMRQWPEMKRLTDAEVAGLSDAVEKSLEALPETGEPTLPSEAASLARMEGMLHDGRFKELADKVVTARLEWLRCMEAMPKQIPTGGPTAKRGGDPLTVTQVAQRLMDSRSVDPFSAEYSLSEVEVMSQALAMPRVSDPSWDLSEALAEDSARNTLREARMQVTHREGQRMAEPWNALVDYLETAAIEAAPLVAEPGRPESLRHHHMRKLLEAQLLSRCRTAMWMSEVMWSDLALSPEGPAPLRPLRISCR